MEGSGMGVRRKASLCPLGIDAVAHDLARIVDAGGLLKRPSRSWDHQVVQVLHRPAAGVQEGVVMLRRSDPPRSARCC